jgi:hypothetical protein
MHRAICIYMVTYAICTPAFISYPTERFQLVPRLCGDPVNQIICSAVQTSRSSLNFKFLNFEASSLTSKLNRFHKSSRRTIGPSPVFYE